MLHVFQVYKYLFNAKNFTKGKACVIFSCRICVSFSIYSMVLYFPLTFPVVDMGAYTGKHSLGKWILVSMLSFTKFFLHSIVSTRHCFMSGLIKPQSEAFKKTHGMFIIPQIYKPSYLGSGLGFYCTIAYSVLHVGVVTGHLLAILNMLNSWFCRWYSTVAMGIKTYSLKLLKPKWDKIRRWFTQTAGGPVSWPGKSIMRRGWTGKTCWMKKTLTSLLLLNVIFSCNYHSICSAILKLVCMDQMV